MTEEFVGPFAALRETLSMLEAGDGCISIDVAEAKALLASIDHAGRVVDNHQRVIENLSTRHVWFGTIGGDDTRTHVEWCGACRIEKVDKIRELLDGFEAIVDGLDRASQAVLVVGLRAELRAIIDAPRVDVYDPPVVVDDDPL